MYTEILIRWVESERSKELYEHYMRKKLGSPPIEDLIREKLAPGRDHPSLQEINKKIPFCS